MQLPPLVFVGEETSVDNGDLWLSFRHGDRCSNGDSHERSDQERIEELHFGGWEESEIGSVQVLRGSNGVKEYGFLFWKDLLGSEVELTDSEGETSGFYRHSIHTNLG